MDTSERQVTQPNQHLASPITGQARNPSAVTGSLTSDLAKLFDVTGGSILYCMSAVLVAYGIVNLLGPVLARGTLRDALPCLLTLHVYEIALLGVLLLIVAKKVIDDAISVTFLIALYLIGTSIAFGSVVGNALHISLCIAVVSVALALGKLYSLRRFAGVPLDLISLLGVTGLIACNYIGPILLSQSIVTQPSAESTRRGLWFIVLLSMLVGGVCNLVSMVRRKTSQIPSDRPSTPFLHTPSMATLLVIVLLICSGVHLYAMAFTFALARSIADFVLVIVVVCLLLLELLRHLNKQYDYLDIALACVPLATVLLAINEKSVISATWKGWAGLGYPPVQLALTGLALAALAWFRRHKKLAYALAAYVLGIILTLGFSPDNPYALNYQACVLTAIAGFLACGLYHRQPQFCVVAVVLLCVELEAWGPLPALRQAYDVTQLGSLAGVFGLGCLSLYLIFGKRFHQTLGLLAAISLAVFVYDYLPDYRHIRYISCCFAVSAVMLAIWLRLRDIKVITILSTPIAVRLYMITRFLGYWRVILLGFLVLGGGILASLLKHRAQQQRRESKQP